MGQPRFAPASIPLHGFEGAQDEYVLYRDDAVFTVGAVSMGNPHAVIEVDDIDGAPVETVAPMLQSHPAFPESVNVGFVRRSNRATASACACTSVASAKRWPAAAAPARPPRC